MRLVALTLLYGAGMTQFYNIKSEMRTLEITFVNNTVISVVAELIFERTGKFPNGLGRDAEQTFTYNEVQAVTNWIKWNSSEEWLVLNDTRYLRSNILSVRVAQTDNSVN